MNRWAFSVMQFCVVAGLSSAAYSVFAQDDHGNAVAPEPVTSGAGTTEARVPDTRDWNAPASLLKEPEGVDGCIVVDRRTVLSPLQDSISFGHSDASGPSGFSQEISCVLSLAPSASHSEVSQVVNERSRIHLDGPIVSTAGEVVSRESRGYSAFQGIEFSRTIQSQVRLGAASAPGLHSFSSLSCATKLGSARVNAHPIVGRYDRQEDESSRSAESIETESDMRSISTNILTAGMLNRTLQSRGFSIDPRCVPQMRTLSGSQRAQDVPDRVRNGI